MISQRLVEPGSGHPDRKIGIIYQEIEKIWTDKRDL